MLHNGVSHRCVCVSEVLRGGIAPSWGAANLPEKVSRDMGYRSDGIAISRDMGPLRKDGYTAYTAYTAGTGFSPPQEGYQIGYIQCYTSCVHPLQVGLSHIPSLFLSHSFCLILSFFFSFFLSFFLLFVLSLSLSLSLPPSLRPSLPPSLPPALPPSHLSV